MVANEALERRVKELEACTAGRLADSAVDGELSSLKDEIRRLRAENLALQSTLHCMHLLHCLKFWHSSLSYECVYIHCTACPYYDSRFFRETSVLPSVLWHCWLGIRKSIQSVKKLSAAVLAWSSVWSEVQMMVKHMVQLMPLPPHHLLSCLIKIQIGLKLLSASLLRLPWERGC